ncbi:aminotransferase class V-fold PLP-dependent enzyme [Oceanobacillus jeddahense]|uniref:aminotransferase class V-fold PLP-dependent enzyme n=1 Tax=Oceanobacillus jeddahense TaxID=1462527 RepID=UPI0005960C98|nr:aminotransferase class V-fold PLP-dependent enzyme [Oceanobacillus jeddahense]
MTVESIFSDDLFKFIRSSFSYLENDPFTNERLYFENSGGSLRLKEVVAEAVKYAAFPDSSARKNKSAKLLKSKALKGIEDIRLFLNAQEGTIAPFHTASKANFEIIRVINDNTDGSNIVTTALEHPSSFDACQIYGDTTKKEVRIAAPNPETGKVEVSTILNLVDSETSLLSVILTSNLTGAIHDIKEIIHEVRKINPEMYIFVDAVQYAPHGIIDIESWPVDALTIAPYKMFGNRGIGFAYLSPRLASLPHNKLIDKDIDDWTIGSLSPSIYASFSKIIDYITTIGSYYTNSNDRRALIVEGMKRIYLYERELIKRLLYGSDEAKGLKDIDGVTVHFTKQPIENRDPIIVLSFDHLTAEEAVSKYEQENIIVCERSKDSPLSLRILQSVGLGSVVRVSPLHCHTFEEIDEFLHVTKRIVSF